MPASDMTVETHMLKAFPVTVLVAVFQRNWFTSALPFALVAAFVGLQAFKRSKAISNPPPASAVPKDKIRICVAGGTHSAPSARAHYLADAIAASNPEKYETWYYFDQYEFWPFVKEKFDPVPFPAHLKGHATMPFVWLERHNPVSGATNEITPIGGSDHFAAWAQENIEDPHVKALAKQPWSVKWYFTGKSYHTRPGAGANATAK